MTATLTSDGKTKLESAQGFAADGIGDVNTSDDVDISAGFGVDNVFIERLWRSLKYEEVYLKAYTTPREAELEIGHYMVFYNEERNHQGLNDLTPDEVYFGRQRYAA